MAGADLHDQAGLLSGEFVESLAELVKQEVGVYARKSVLSRGVRPKG